MKPNCTFKTYFFLLMGLLFSQTVLSAPISRQKAQQNAQEFLQQKGIDIKQSALRQAPMSGTNKMESAPYLNNDDGYVVAFGDERTSNVLGYSTQGHLEKAKVMRNISNNAESDYIVEFEDKKIKQICVDNWDISGDGEVSEYELSLVKDLNGVFTNFDNNDGHERYDNTFWELSYFTGLTSINDNEFGNSSIWAVSIPENVTRIGDNAFQRLYSVYIPKNVNSIGYKAFGSVGHIKVDPDNKWYDSRNDCNALIETATNTLVLGCENTVIPEGVKIIGDEAMSFCQYYSNTLSIPEGVTSIGRDAFSGVLFSSVTIPQSVKEIKSRAFSCCDFLKSVTVKWDHPIEIDENVFYSWSINDIYEHCTLYVPQGTKAAYEVAKGWKNFYKIVEEDIVEFEDKKIKQICVDNWDISGDGEVSEYELSLVKDLNGVFTNFDNNDGHERYDNTFWELSYFTGLTSINDNEFGNSSIWAVSIPENVTRIGDNAFQRLYSVYIPKNVNSIGYKAFGSVGHIKVDPDNKWYDSRNDCNALIETATNTLVLGCENTVIPEGVKIIGDEAMSFCQYYSNTLSIPEGVTSIGRDAFSGVLFSSVTIPKSVKEIKSKAFSFCDFLESFTVNWIHPIDIDDDVFMSWSHNQIYEDCTLYVPRGTKAAYQAAKGWKNFLKIEEVGKLVGDVNGDDVVNIVDVITTVNYILGNGEDTFDETVADMNDDGNVNIVDVTLIVNAILGK